MLTSKRLTALMAIGLSLCSVYAGAQTVQTANKKEQVSARSSTAKASHPFRIRLGGFTFGAGYSRYSGYFPYYSYYPYSFYRPWYYDPFYPSLYNAYSPLMIHPGWYAGFARRDGMGEIKLQSSPKDADVFIDDALAGKAKDLKTIWLEPGAYNLKVQAERYEPFVMRVYVLSGKTLKVDANLAPQKEP
jgi:hypothetical protein